KSPIRIGFVGSGFPLVYENIDGHLSGIHKEMWMMALRGYEIQWEKREVYGSYDPNENGYFDGMLGEMQNGTLDIALQVKDFSYREARMDVLYYTRPVEEAEENFYERRQIVFDPAIIIVPFTPDFTAVLVTLIIAMKLTKTAIRVLSSKWGGREGSFGASSRSLSLLSALIHRLAIILVLIIYNASFVGLSTAPGVEPERTDNNNYQRILQLNIYTMFRTLQDIIPLLKQGEVKMIVNYDGVIKDTMMLELFDNDPAGDTRRYQPISDMEEKENVLCHTPSSVYFGIIFSITHNDPDKIYKHQCAFKKIDSTNLRFLPSGSELIKRRIGMKRLSTFYMSRKTVSQRLRERFSWVQLTLFQRNTIDIFWWRRFTHRPRFENDKPPKYWFQPIGLAAFETIFIVFGSLLAFDLIVFLLEIVHSRFFPETGTAGKRIYRMLTYII
ncbi:hypothetical protein PENTCL1PPCAC_3097, partial [Pristionchus entomophagus]